jgi:D-beta-D-heptose 7-phosphate kinase / D-beta-D-heptose 1-phosphate adenosyltransferase
MKVLVIGDSMLDFTRFGTITRRSPEAHKCPVFVERIQQWELGGAANVARWLAAVPRTKVKLATPHGGEFTSVRLQCLCHDAGITLLPLLTETRRDVTVKERIVAEDLELGTIQHLVRIDKDEVGELHRTEILPFQAGLRGMHEWDAIVAVDYDKMVFRGEAGEQLATWIGENLNLTVVNSKVPQRWVAEPTTFLVCNHEEMATFNVATVAAAAQAAKARCFVVTEGRGGVTAVLAGPRDAFGNRSDAAILHRVTATTDVVDVCGAGDAFLAGLTAEAGRYSKQSLWNMKPVELVDMLDRGQHAAAWCCGQVGVGNPLAGDWP